MTHLKTNNPYDPLLPLSEYNENDDKDWFEKMIDKYGFQTGDLLLFEHTYDWKNLKDLLFNVMDSTIGYLTRSKYTHTAMIIKDPCWRSDLKGYYLLESNWEYIKDSEDNEIKIGVELMPLKKIFELNGVNKLWYRKLRCKRDEMFDIRLERAQSVVHNRPYDLDLFDWVKALFGVHKGNERKKDTFWCSALMAYMYVQFGFLPEGLDWTIVSPMQLGTEYPNKSLLFQNCELNPEILLEYDVTDTSM